MDVCAVLDSCGITSWPDVFRVIDIILALLITGGLIFDRYAPSRCDLSMRMLTFAIAGGFMWNAYTFAEVVWFTTDPEGVTDKGYRAYGFAFWYTLVLIALFIRRRRLRRLRCPPV